MTSRLSPDQDTSLKEITGPAIVYLNKQDEILWVIERERKSWKRPWQFFVPAWKKMKDEDVMHAVFRETAEETGLNCKSFKMADFQSKWNIILQTDDSKIDISVFSYNKKLDSNILLKNNNFFQNEIIQRTFLDIKELLEFDVSKIRPWLYEILYLFLGWTIKDKIYIEDGEYHPNDFARIKDIKREIKRLL